VPRASRLLKLPYGATKLPFQLLSDGRALVMLMMPPSALRPKAALGGRDEFDLFDVKKLDARGVRV